MSNESANRRIGEPARSGVGKSAKLNRLIFPRFPDSPIRLFGLFAFFLLPFTFVLYTSIAHSASQPSITTTSLLPATVNAAYTSNTLQATGGVPPFTWTVTAGSLPQGLVLDASHGIISGSPTTIGYSSFTLQAADAQSPPVTSSRTFSLPVFPALDLYGGFANTPEPGGGTGYFRVQKTNGRWQWIDPLGNLFYQRSMYVVSRSFLLNWTAKYGGNVYAWATNELNRMQAWGFNALDIYSETYTYPVGVNGSHNHATPQLPFFPNQGCGYYVIQHPTLLGLPEKIKDTFAGQDSNGYHGYDTQTIDVFDPNWTVAQTSCTNAFAGIFTDPINTDPWVLGISIGDPGFVDALVGGGEAKTCQGIAMNYYAHAAMAIATDHWNYNDAELCPAGNCWLRPLLYSKFAWTCGGNNPASCDGTSYLEQKYHNNIGALNQAWGTNNYYTSFGDAGGFGTGTGVLDEDGRHKQWFCGSGTCSLDYFLQTGMNANLKADLDQFLYLFTKQVYTPMTSSIRKPTAQGGWGDTNHVITCLVGGGNGGGTWREPIAHGAVDGGCQVIGLTWNPKCNDYSLGLATTAYSWTGVPMQIDFSDTANADSYWNQYPSNMPYGDYPTQPLRGQSYAHDMNNILNLQATNGDYILMGTSFWADTDNGTGEKTDFGVISPNDNVYDGNASIIAPGVDAWGWTSGGEAGNFGDYLDAVTRTNVCTAAGLMGLGGECGAGGGGGGALTAPTLSLPQYLPINAQISAGYNGSDPVDHYYWTFTPQTPGSQGKDLGTGGGSLGRAGLPAGQAGSGAGTGSFSSKSPQLDLASQPLILGPYLITVQAFDSSGNSSPVTQANTTLVPGDLSGVREYPNPWRSDRGYPQKITFDNLTVNTTIKIFTVSGHWVKTLPTSSTSVTWDLTNDSGDQVGSGIYLYLMKSDSGEKATGKLVIIK